MAARPRVARPTDYLTNNDRHWRPDVRQRSHRRERTGLLIDAEHRERARVLIRGDQPLARRVEGKIPRRLASSRFVLDELRPPVDDTLKTAMLSWPRFDP